MKGATLRVSALVFGGMVTAGFVACSSESEPGAGSPQTGGTGGSGAVEGGAGNGSGGTGAAGAAGTGGVPTDGAALDAPPDDVTPVPSNFDVDDYLIDTGEIPESSAWEPSGNFRLICEFSHLGYDDPIVYPGQPGASHLHMFFGNTEADAFSTYQSLRTTGDGTCQGGPINRSGYWAPAVLNAAGQVVAPDYITIYYKGGASTRAEIEAVQSLPAGLRMIAGYDMADPNAPRRFEWKCETTPGTNQGTIPSCPDGDRVGVVLPFPTCWDGVHLDSANHRSHMAYRFYDDNGVFQCPSTHPALLPEFTLGIWFTHDNDSADWQISSDMMPAHTHPAGSTFHSDWFGAWDLDIQDVWTKLCINGMLNCEGGELGDGRVLSAAPDYQGPRLIAAPPKP